MFYVILVIGIAIAIFLYSAFLIDTKPYMVLYPVPDSDYIPTRREMKFPQAHIQYQNQSCEPIPLTTLLALTPVVFAHDKRWNGSINPKIARGFLDNITQQSVKEYMDNHKGKWPVPCAKIPLVGCPFVVKVWYILWDIPAQQVEDALNGCITYVMNWAGYKKIRELSEYPGDYTIIDAYKRSIAEYMKSNVMMPGINYNICIYTTFGAVGNKCFLHIANLEYLDKLIAYTYDIR